MINQMDAAKEIGIVRALDVPMIIYEKYRYKVLEIDIIVLLRFPLARIYNLVHVVVGFIGGSLCALFKNFRL